MTAPHDPATACDDCATCDTPCDCPGCGTPAPASGQTPGTGWKLTEACEPCPLDHRCEEGEACACWCELHDCPIAECPTYRLVTAWLDRANAERDEARYDLNEARRDVVRIEEQRDQAWATIRQFTADNDGLTGQLAVTTVERDEARAQTAELTEERNYWRHQARELDAQVRQLIAAGDAARTERDRQAEAYRTLVGDLPELGRRLRELVDELRDAGVDAATVGATWTEALRAAGEDGPARPLYATETGPDGAGVPESTPTT